MDYECFFSDDWKQPTGELSIKELPQPLRDLMQSNGSTTSFLEALAGLLTAHIEQRQSRNDLKRAIVLCNTNGEAVSLGYSEVKLNKDTPEALRKELTAGKKPLGKILQQLSIQHTRSPSTAYKFKSSFIDKLFKQKGTYFGRKYTITGNGINAHIIEVFNLVRE